MGSEKHSKAKVEGDKSLRRELAMMYAGTLFAIIGTLLLMIETFE